MKFQTEKYGHIFSLVFDLESQIWLSLAEYVNMSKISPYDNSLQDTILSAFSQDHGLHYVMLMHMIKVNTSMFQS